MFSITKREKFLFGIIVLLIIAISGTVYINNKVDETVINASNNASEIEAQREPQKEEKSEVQSEVQENTEIAVYICGAVKNPGVYKIINGTRLSELLNLCGGAINGADLTEVNLAKKLIDEEKVYIPKTGEKIEDKIQTSASSAGSSNKSSGTKSSNSKVNINTATVDELDTLPGIGPAYAQRIIDYRTSNGSFKSVEEIKEVSGIGDKKYESLKELITVN